MAVAQLPRRIPGATSRPVRTWTRWRRAPARWCWRATARWRSAVRSPTSCRAARSSAARCCGWPATRAPAPPRWPSSSRPRFTALGEWAAAVDLDATLGPLAAAEAGVALERFAVVRRVPPARWATVVAALLDGVSLVLAEVPRGVRLGDARRLEARAREREAVLVVAEPHGVAWPAGAAYVVHAAAQRVGRPRTPGAGVLGGRRLQVRVEGRGAAARPRCG